MIQTLKNKLNKKKGFTLAELLVVVAIIAILVAIAIPMFGAANEKAYIGVAQANARSAYAEWAIAYIADGTTPQAGDTITYQTGGKETVCTVVSAPVDANSGDLAMSISVEVDGKDCGSYSFSSESKGGHTTITGEDG